VRRLVLLADRVAVGEPVTVRDRGALDHGVALSDRVAVS